MSCFRVKYDLEYNDGTGLYRFPKAPELIKISIDAGCDTIFFDSGSDYDPLWFDQSALAENYGDQVFFNVTDGLKFLWLSEPVTGSCLDAVLSWLKIYPPGDDLLVSPTESLAISATEELLIR